MAVTLRKYLNSKLKEKGLTVKEAKKNAGKYKSIAAAKKAGSLYYTNKDGKVMAAVYAEDLKKPLKPIKPKKRPSDKVPVAKPEDLKISKVSVSVLLPKSNKTIASAIEEGKNPPGSKFDEWYKKNKDKYKNRARAMEAYKMGVGRTESTRYGKSKGGLTKSSGILNTGIAKPENTYK